MYFTLFDDAARLSLLPFTHTRPAADIRCGILTMRERWELLLKQPTATLTEDYLQPAYTTNASGEISYINGRVFATKELLTAIHALQPGSCLVKDALVIAVRTDVAITFNCFTEQVRSLTSITFPDDVHVLKNVWDIFQQNDRAIRDDFKLLTSGKKSAPLPDGVTVSGKENLFIEEGANIYPGCIINATTGPVYIAKDTDILEGTMIRGPLALCEHGVIKMGAKIYGATTIGPGCKVGGEINNAIFFANSNKAHDGYLGNAVIGEWCNLGADTNCSNLKNNYDEVKIWDEHNFKSISTGLTFCGLLMGDHSKCAINTAFNTGTVVGVSANIFGSGFSEKFIPSFTWGGSDHTTTYQLNRAMDTANRMMGRRNRKLSAAETEMYRHIFEATEKQRALFTNDK